MENVRFRTINVIDLENKIVGRVTAASEKINEGDFRLGFAYWNASGPKRFNRKFYQEIARGRMECGRTAVLTAKREGVPLIQNIKNCARGFAAMKEIKWMFTTELNLV